MVLRSGLDSPGQVWVDAPPVWIEVAKNILIKYILFLSPTLTIPPETRPVKLDKETCSEEWSGVCYHPP